MKLSALKSLGHKLEEGVWKTYGNGVEVLLAPLNNRRYESAVQRLSQPVIMRRRKGSLTPEEMSKFNKQAVAEAILLDWRGVETDDGEPVKYSQQEALSLFEANHMFFRFVLETANELADERAEVRGDTEGNSSTSLGGTLSGATIETCSRNERVAVPA